MINDDYTPMDFVVHVLQKFFKIPEPQALTIMLQVHQKGFGVCGIFINVANAEGCPGNSILFGFLLEVNHDLPQVRPPVFSARKSYEMRWGAMLTRYVKVDPCLEFVLFLSPESIAAAYCL